MEKTEFTQARKKTDLLYMLEMMMRNPEAPEEKRNNLKIYIINVDQGPNSCLYTTKTNVAFLNTCIERLPRNYEHLDGIQRALKQKNVDDIEQGHLKSSRYDTPNSVTIMLKEQCNFYELQDVAGMNEIKCLVIHLDQIYEYLNSPEAETNEEGFLIDPEAATIGYMIDGHHRNEGAYNAAKKIKEVMEEREIQDNDEVYQKYQYEFPTSIYIGRSRKDMAGIFGGINNKQQKPSAIHVMAIRQMSLDLDEEEDLAARVMEKMNSENDSVLKDRIKVCDGRLPKGAPATFLNNAKMVKLITDWWKVAMKNPSSWKCKGTDNNIYTFLNDYLTAYKEVFPEAWDNKNYVLTKTMGFDIIFSICNQLTLNAVDISGVNRLPDKDAFVSILQKVFFTKDDSGNMVPVEVELDGENAVPFNWESSIYGSHSSGKGINILKKIVEQLIISRVDH